MKTRVFKSGNSKAVRIPVSIPLSGPEVEIVDQGAGCVLLKEIPDSPDPWTLFREGVAELAGEWPDRIQEAGQDRGSW